MMMIDRRRTQVPTTEGPDQRRSAMQQQERLCAGLSDRMPHRSRPPRPIDRRRGGDIGRPDGLLSDEWRRLGSGTPPYDRNATGMRTRSTRDAFRSRAALCHAAAAVRPPMRRPAGRPPRHRSCQVDSDPAQQRGLPRRRLFSHAVSLPFQRHRKVSGLSASSLMANDSIFMGKNLFRFTWL